MKLPDPGPTLRELVTEIDLERLSPKIPSATTLPLIEKANGCDYLGWEELRRQPMPDHLSEREVWLIVKFSRGASRRYVPLADVEGRPFHYWLPNALQAQLHHIDQHAGGDLLADDPKAIREYGDRFVISSLMDEAIASSQIEGASTTRQVAKEMLRTRRRPRNRDEQMIFNNYATIQRLRANRHLPLSVEMLCDIQWRMTQDTLDDATAAGRLRRADEDIVVQADDGTVLHRPPHADTLPQRLEHLCAYANAPPSDDGTRFEHPVVKAMILHFWLGYDHPFVDGNGRTARALFHWYMLKQDYWLLEYLPVSPIIHKAQAQYRRAFLMSERDENDLTYFLAFHLTRIRQAIEELRTKLQRKRRQAQHVLNELADRSSMNQRQAALIAHALKHPGFRYTVRSHATSHGVSRQTARVDLEHLEDAGLLERGKHGRAVVWIAPADLDERLGRVRQGEAKRSLPGGR